MPYKVTFWCGAELIVETSPRQRKYKDKPRSTSRNGLLRVVVWSHCPGGGPYNPGVSVRLRNGIVADCHGCRGFSRKSGRTQYKCFPPDYERENRPGGKYDGKKFAQICENVIACFPKTVVKLPVVEPGRCFLCKKLIAAGEKWAGYGPGKNFHISCLKEAGADAVVTLQKKALEASRIE